MSCEYFRKFFCLSPTLKISRDQYLKCGLLDGPGDAPPPFLPLPFVFPTTTVGTFLICLGSFVLVTTFCGCCGACTDNKCLLGVVSRFTYFFRKIQIIFLFYKRKLKKKNFKIKFCKFLFNFKDNKNLFVFSLLLK